MSFQRITRNIRLPIILSFKEKHGDRLFVIQSPEDLQKASLKILSERLEEGCWYEEPEFVASPSVTKAQVEALPKGSTKNAALKEWYEYDMAVKREDEKTKEWQSIQKAVADKNGILAFDILESRDNHEYEGMEVIFPEKL